MGLLDSHPNKYLPHDEDTNSLRYIDAVHAMVHRGYHYTATHAVAIGTATAATVMITAPATGAYHLAIGMQANNTGYGAFSEAPNATGGTAITAYNNNRNSANVSTLTHTKTATVTSAGTVLQNFVLGTDGKGNVSSGGAGEMRTEWILKPSTKYLFSFTALNAATRVAMNLSYYLEQ